MPPSKLYFGDNLDILRKHIRDESIDLIYLDPPFNSKADYNILFKTPKGIPSPSQITAFEDTWHWTTESEKTYDNLVYNSKIAPVIEGLKNAIGKNDMMAYIVMMAVRVIELHRVLKPTGSLWLHCDPTASHYLKVVADAIFNPKNFGSEIIWRRVSSDQKGSQHKSKKFGSNHDVILFYYKNSKKAYREIPTKELTEEEMDTLFPLEDEYGRYNTQTPVFRSPSLGSRPNLCYTWRGITNQHPSGWRLSKKRLEEEYQKGNIEITDSGRVIRKARAANYRGETMGDVWTDIPPALGDERMGYPTQKPLALLERIIETSSREGDVVLDPFCGCGTAVHAAQKLNRSWIGIDITHLAVNLIKKRMKDAFGITVDITGIPKSFDGAEELARLNKFQFELWAVSLIPNAMPNNKQVGDRGIDGIGYIKLDNKTAKIIISVKGGETLNPSMVRDLRGVMEREKADFGIFVSLREPTRKMSEEAAAAGNFKTPFAHYPKLQIYTISDYFKGIPPRLPTMMDHAKARPDQIQNRGSQTTL